MYKVYRWLNDMPQELLATCGTLREAYDWARRAARRERRRAIAIRILGPAPSDPRAGRHSQSASSDAAPRQYWFVLDGVLPTKGAILASAVLQRVGGEVDGGGAPRPRETPRSTAQQPAPAAPAPTTDAALQPSKKRFSVVRLSQRERITVGTEFMSRAEAQEYIAMRRGYEHDPGVTYMIEACTPDACKSTPRRSNRRVRNYQQREGQRERIYREREGRRDLSLITRSDDELGLGIPAQWGKGRKSRKGEYIP